VIRDKDVWREGLGPAWGQGAMQTTRAPKLACGLLKIPGQEPGGLLDFKTYFVPWETNKISKLQY